MRPKPLINLNNFEMKNYTKLEFSLKGTFDKSLSVMTLTSQYSISVIATGNYIFYISYNSPCG